MVRVCLFDVCQVKRAARKHKTPPPRVTFQTRTKQKSDKRSQMNSRGRKSLNPHQGKRAYGTRFANTPPRVGARGYKSKVYAKVSVLSARDLANRTNFVRANRPAEARRPA